MESMLSNMWKQVQKKFSNEEDSRLDNLDETFTSFCRTPLHIAVMSGDIKFATKILSKPEGLALALKQDSNGLTPLHLASVRTSLPMVRLLLGADPGACIVQDEDGRTPLHLAAMKNRVEIMKVLMEDGLPEAIHLKNNQTGETILHFCVKSNTRLKTLKLLVNKLVSAPLPDPNPNPISINSTDIGGNTILHLATEMGNMKITNYLMLNSIVKMDIKVVNNKGERALNMLSQAERNDLEFEFYDYHLRHDMHKRKTLSTNGDHGGLKDRVNALLVVATLVAGIAFQAAMNPPGGVWQDDSKVHSGTDPITFGYYLNHMYTSGGLDSYIKDTLQYAEDTYPRNGSKRGSHSNIAQFVKSLRILGEYYSESIDYGLILEDFVFNLYVSYYNNSTGNSGNGSFFFPYLVRYAGNPILAYTWPVYYMVYMITNGVAFCVSLVIIFMVICGFTIETSVTQVRILVVLMCISIGCIAFSFFTILVAMVPDYLGGGGVYFVLQVIFGVCCLLGVLWFFIRTARRIVQIQERTRHHHIGVITYLKVLFFGMDASAAGKLIVFLVGYCVFRLTGYFYYNDWSYVNPFLY